MKKKRLLIYAEYTSILLLALGAMVATNSGQVSLAAIPLTFALSLNLINRKQHPKQNLQIDKNDIILLQERITNLNNLFYKQIESIEDSLQTKASSEDIEQVYQPELNVIKQNIELIHDNLEGLNNHNQTNDIVLEERINNLNNWLQKQIKNIEENLITKASSGEIKQVCQVEITVVRQTMESIQDNLERLHSRHQAKDIVLEERINNLNDLLQKQIQNLEVKLNNKASSEDIEQIYQPEITVVKQNIELIRGNLEHLNNRNQAKDIILEERIDNLNDLLQKQIQNLEEELKNKASSEDIEQVYQPTIAMVRQSIKSIQDNFKKLHNRSQTNKLEFAVTPIKEKLNPLENQENTLDTTCQYRVKTVITPLVEKEKLENVLSKLSQYQTKQSNEYLEKITKSIEEIELEFAAFKSDYKNLVSKENI